MTTEGDSKTDIRKHILRMRPDERSSAYVSANCYRWPDALIQHKPDGWDEMKNYPDRHNSIEFRAMMDSIYESTSEFERSRAWWIENLHRTSEDHLEWWLNGRTSL